MKYNKKLLNIELFIVATLSLLIVFILIDPIPQRVKKVDVRKIINSDWINLHGYHDFLTIKDSLAATDYMDIFRPYYFYNDTLFIDNKPLYGRSANLRANEMEHYYKYYIDSISSNYIWHNVGNNKYVPFYYSTDKYYNENIILRSIEIVFSGSGRERGLSHWRIYIDDKLTSYFKIEAVRKVKKIFLPLPFEKGDYFAQLTPKEFVYIQNKVQRIQYSDLKKEYLRNHGAFFNFGFKLKINLGYKDSPKINSIMITCTDHNQLPKPLLVLVNYLKNIHYFVKYSRTDRLHEFELR